LNLTRISVVIPLYNKEPHIARAIDSVLGQTVPDFDIIVVDDGSTDKGAEIVTAYADPRIRILRQDNQGASSARNRGIYEAKADLIAFLDADDEWEKDHLETILRLRRNFPKAGAYTTAYVHVFPIGETFPAKYEAIPPAPWEGLLQDYFKSVAYGETPVWSSAVAIPGHVFGRVGVFNVGENLGEDLDMWGRIALHFDIAFSWQGKAHYREDAIGRTSMENRLERELPFVSTVREYFKGQEIPHFVRIYLGELNHQLICSLVSQGRKTEALGVLLSENPFSIRKDTLLNDLSRIVLPRILIRALSFMKRAFSA
jgi:glycosyltransferase involved in cell wall biosynthesis